MFQIFHVSLQIFPSFLPQFAVALIFLKENVHILIFDFCFNQIFFMQGWDIPPIFQHKFFDGFNLFHPTTTLSLPHISLGYKAHLSIYETRSERNRGDYFYSELDSNNFKIVGETGGQPFWHVKEASHPNSYCSCLQNTIYLYYNMSFCSRKIDIPFYSFVKSLPQPKPIFF